MEASVRRQPYECEGTAAFIFFAVINMKSPRPHFPLAP